MEGLVLFDKPQNYTSTQIVNYFKKLTKKKVGHGGTLDPFAEGLLILGIGEYTKELTKFLKESRKTYIAEIELGAVSDTYDITGKITRTDTDLTLTYADIEKILQSFIGEIEQTPPPYSAVKIKGKRAYKLARKGIEVDLKPRKVFIYDIKILDYQHLNPRKSATDNNPCESAVLKIETVVSSGTYIRSLANDLGQKLGCGAYLKSLIRTKINEFKLEEALSFKDIEKDYLEFYAKVYGRVQGVGYRYFVRDKARNLDVFGYVKNLLDGTVEVLAQGREEKLQKLIEELKKGPFLAQVDKLDVIFRKPLNIFTQFQIAY